MAKEPNTYWTAKDHDTLIEIKAILEVVNKRLDTFTIETQTKFVTYDKRISDIEKLIDTSNPKENMIKFYALLDEWEQFKTKKQVWMGIGSATWGIAGAVIGALIVWYLTSRL